MNRAVASMKIRDITPAFSMIRAAEKSFPYITPSTTKVQTRAQIRRKWSLVR